LARLRDGERLRYRLSGGRGVRLDENDLLAGTPWLAVAHLDAGLEEGRIFLAAPVEPSDLTPLARPVETLAWDARSGVLRAQRELRVGEVALAVEPLRHPDSARRREILCQVVRTEGLELLPWTEELRQWQARVLSLRNWRPEEGWPDVSDTHLLETLEAWLAPWLDGVSRREDFARLELQSILGGLLPWPLPARLEALAPTRLQVPSGSYIRLRYSPDGTPPVLAVKLQEMFGLADTPTVNEGRTKVLLHLLSPAQRPIQVTQDLRSFWNQTYPEVRKELRGRYPKHPWPEDPWNAQPTRKTKPR
jgi:ATP-dependent helicase HrpB